MVLAERQNRAGLPVENAVPPGWEPVQLVFDEFDEYLRDLADAFAEAAKWTAVQHWSRWPLGAEERWPAWPWTFGRPLFRRG